MKWPFDNDYNYNYQTETFNLVYDTAEFNYKNLKGVNNRWLKLVDAAYVIGTGSTFEKFKKQAEFQGIEEITHYVKIKKLKDLDQKFRIKKDYYLNNAGCQMSHVSCCYNAMTKGYKNIIIFEDDCYFTKYITDDEIEALVNIKNKKDPNYLNLGPHSLHNGKTCNRPEIELIQMPTFMTHFIYLNTVGMNQWIKTKYERPWKPFRLSGYAKGYIDRDWFGADDFWYSFTNSYVLGVRESNPWAIQYVPDDTEERNSGQSNKLDDNTKKLNEIIENKIRNKKVAIIGPADYVRHELGDEHNDFLNTFDTVIRLNSMVFDTKEAEKPYGFKYDIIMGLFWTGNYKDYDKDTFNDPDCEIGFPKYMKKKYWNNIKEDTKFIAIDKYLSNIIDLYDLKINYAEVDEHRDLVPILNNIKNKMTHFPKLRNGGGLRSGMHCINWVVDCNPSELYISGFTFNCPNKYKLYNSEYGNSEYDPNKKYHMRGDLGTHGPIKGRVDFSTNTQPFNVMDNKCHDFEIERYLIKYYIDNDKLYTDKFIKKLINENT